MSNEIEDEQAKGSNNGNTPPDKDEVKSHGVDEPKIGVTDPSNAPLPAKEEVRFEGVDELVVGGTDHSGGKITRMYHKELGKYAIYETEKLEVKIWGDVASLAGGKINELLSQIADYRNFDDKVKKKYNSRQALAMRIAVDGDGTACERMLQSILESMRLYLVRESQIPYVLGALSPLPCMLAVFGLVYKLQMIDALGVRIYGVMVFAAMGGIMSVAIGLRKLDLNPLDNQLVNYLYGVLRIIIAMIAGVVMLFLIESGVALAFLKDVKDVPYGYGYLVASFLAGFSEMVVPNIIRKMDKQAGE